MNKLMSTILYNLPQDSYITAKQLADKVLVSEKTVRTYLKDLSECVFDYGAEIESKHGYGYRLVVQKPDEFSRIYIEKSKRDDEIYFPENGEDRAAYIIWELIRKVDFVPIEFFLDYLCISDSTLQADISRAKKIAGSYKLKIIFKKGKGYFLEGSEYNKRSFIVNHVEDLFLTNNQLEMKKEISAIFVSELNRSDISMPEISLNNMVQHIYLAIRRIQNQQYIEEGFFSFEGSEEYALSLNIAKILTKKLEKKFCIAFPNGEVDNLALHLVGHRVTEKYGFGNSNTVISQEIYDLVLEIIQFINYTLKIDLRRDLNTIMNLAIHMVSLDIRLKYSIRLKNPLLEDIKKNYSFGFTLANQAKTCIDNKYGTHLDADEIGYLALIFQISIINKKKVHKKNILIVCATGKTSAELLSYQYREMFGSYLGTIKICNLSEIESQDFLNIDYVLSTAPISVAVPVPILRVRMMLSDEEEMLLADKFRKSSERSIDIYFRKELFFTDLISEEKNDVIFELCKKVGEVYSLPEGFAESVIHRESFAPTDFGENVALAHPYGLVTETTIAAVGILRKPVFWGNNSIQIVFLLSVSDQLPDDIQNFYKKMSGFMLDSSKSKALLENPTHKNLIRLLEG